MNAAQEFTAPPCAHKSAPRVPVTAAGNRHYCHDENATIVNDRWLCNCFGSPYHLADATEFSGNKGE